MGKSALSSPCSMVGCQDRDLWWQVSGVSPSRSSRVHSELCCHMAPVGGSGMPAGCLGLAGGDAGVTGAECPQASVCLIIQSLSVISVSSWWHSLSLPL